jgi:hypothetical protein
MRSGTLPMQASMSVKEKVGVKGLVEPATDCVIIFGNGI